MSAPANPREPTAATRIAVGLSLGVLAAAPFLALWLASTATAAFVTALSIIGFVAVIARGGVATFLGIDPSA